MADSTPVRDAFQTTGTKINVVKNGRVVPIDSGALSSFEKAGYSQYPVSNPTSTVTPPATSPTGPAATLAPGYISGTGAGLNADQYNATVKVNPASPLGTPAMQSGGDDVMRSGLGLDSSFPSIPNGSTAVRSIYGVNQPTYTAPDTSKEDALLNNYDTQGQADQIARDLAEKKKAIMDTYGIRENEIRSATENERLSQISNLSSVGYVNPASSGLTSIGSANAKTLDSRIAANNAQRDAEIAAAESEAYGRKTAAQDKVIANAKLNRERADQQAQDAYARDRQALLDNVDIVNCVVNYYRQGKQLSVQEKSQAQDSAIKLLASGSQTFDNVKPEALAEIEKSAGWPTGSLSGAIKAVKEKEIQAEKENNKPELREVGGSLYAITHDKDGKASYELVIASPKTGAGTSTKLYSAAAGLRDDIAAGKLDFVQAYRLLAQQFPEFNKHVNGTSGPSFIDNALGGQVGFNAQGAYDPTKSTGYAVEGYQPPAKNLTGAQANTADIWKGLADPAMAGQSDEIKAQYIMANGGDPSKFGIVI